MSHTNPEWQIAVIETENVIYYSNYCPQPLEPHSAVTQIIQGLYQNRPDEALRLLRRPIITNYNPTLLCRGMIAVAAKRYLINKHFSLENTHKNLVPIRYLIEHSQNTSLPSPSSTLSSPIRDKDCLSNKANLNTWLSHYPTYPRHKSIRAALTDSRGVTVLAAESDSKINKTLHAEVVLLQKYFSVHAEGFKVATQLHTNLQSCKMCAAMFWHMHTDPWKNLKASYYYAEQGSIARDTLFTSGSNSRRAIARNNTEIFQSVEKLLTPPIKSLSIG